MNTMTIGERWRRIDRDAEPTMQYGAIPYRVVDGEIEFLVVTSRRTNRWIFPKGSPIEGLNGAETAAQEAFEEAGIRGYVDPSPLGDFQTIKQRLKCTLLNIQTFALRVEEELDDWPEKGQRERRWIKAGALGAHLLDDGAVELANELAERIDAAKRTTD